MTQPFPTLPPRRRYTAVTVAALALVLASGALAWRHASTANAELSVLAVTAVGAICVGAYGLFVSMRTFQPLASLREQTADIDREHTDADLPTDHAGELGELARAIDALRVELGATSDDLETARDHRDTAAERADRVEATARAYTEVLRDCADGDLSQRMDPDADTDAMAALAEAFNETMRDIEETVDQMRSVAGETATASGDVTESAQAVESASEQVTRSIQKISDGADRQDQSLQSVSSEMDGLSTTIEEIASTSNEVADIAQRTAETGRNGQAAARAAIEGMNEIESVSEEAIAEMDALATELSEVDDLTEFIQDVADQTNMLALNANIEASRADASGDADEGFAVVAREVKELADDTKEAAENIERRLDRIQEQAEAAAASVEETGDRVDENTEAVRSAAASLEEIATYAQETNTGVQDISAATEEQAASTEEVVAMVDEAATISDRTSTEAENVAKAAEQQTEAMQTVSESTRSLSKQADRLRRVLDRFQTDSEGVSFPDDWETPVERKPPAFGDSVEVSTTEDERVEREITAPLSDDASGRTDDSGAGAADALDGDAGDQPVGADEESLDASVDAFALRQAVIDAYPGDEPPWHAMARINLKTNYDLETVDPGDRIPAADRDAVVTAAEDVTGRTLDI